MTQAVFFDVDFTLIHPGPRFQGVGYRDSCARYGITVDVTSFDAAVAAASSSLDTHGGLYDPDIFIRYTRRIIEGMGGRGDGIDDAARDIYDEWSECHHFTLYDEVPDVLRAIHAAGVKIGLISNTQRSLETFQTHFELEGLFSVAVSSADHGFMKPHPSIFEAALAHVGAVPAQSVMVGDSLIARHRRSAPARHAGGTRIAVGTADRVSAGRPGDPVIAGPSAAVVRPIVYQS